MNPIRTVVLLSVVATVLACSRAPEPVPPVTQPAKPATNAPKAVELTGPIPMQYEEPTVGGAKMAMGENIMTNLVKSKDHTIFVSALKAAGLDEVLAGPGPLTVFAPTNAAFESMPGGYKSLLQPDAQDRLVAILSYHIAPQKLDDMTLANMVMAGRGTASFATVEGHPLKATVGNGGAMIVDTKGGVSRITVPNVLQGNGVLQVVDKVLIP
ncbi:MAG: fasciclin domain-containing protein [Pseudomonadota bacterium]|nr:fasciclin domain-containing protein [Pseudomonadota bacterium]